MPWQQIVANLINTVLVLLAVEGIKKVLPIINASVPWILPIIAAVIGPAVALIQGYVGSWLGVNVDLSPIVAIFTGGSAVALYQVGKQFSKGGQG